MPRTKSKSEREETSSRGWVESQSFVDDRPDSQLAIHHWQPAQAVPSELPSTRLLVAAKSSKAADTQTICEVTDPWARDLPIWLASGKVDLFRLLGSFSTYDGERQPAIKPLITPEGFFRGGRTNGKMAEAIYWQILEAGFHIPPSAASDFGSSPNPLGYHRIYAASGTADAERWWQAAASGQSFVTSGQLLRAEVNRELPGAVFESTGDKPVRLEVALKLTVADPVEYLDIIFNGQQLYQAKLDEYAKAGGKIPPLTIDESGWLVVRVVTEHDFTYRIASTAPYYVEFDNQPRISRRATTFFRNWLAESRKAIEKLPTEQALAHAPYLDAAEDFWQKREEQANAN